MSISVESQVQPIANYLLAAAQINPRRRLIVAISGIPGSGKSTFAEPLVDTLNKLYKERTGFDDEVATCVGMDGWHYSRDQLKAMDNPELYIARRGAHFTFDGQSYLNFVQSLDDDSRDIPFPSFSHAAKDPVANGGAVKPTHRIIVIEGLHALLNKDPWAEAAKRYDERIWVETSRDLARGRLISRHLATGVEASPEAAAKRVDESDLLNADLLLGNLIPHTIKVCSPEEAAQTPVC